MGLVSRITLSLAALGCAATVALATSAPAGISPDEALQKLLDGNKNYVANQLTNGARSGAETRASLAKSQKPYAVVLTCSDSRVPPELLFDKGLGELFVIRVAGNIPDPVVVGSIEYAVEHLGSPLVMVLGHERCGAVKATVESKGKSTGSPNIDAIAKTVAKSIKQATKECEACKGDSKCADTHKDELVECVVNANAKNVTASLTKQSKIIREFAHQGKIKVVTAKYDLDDGKVTVMK